MSQYVIGQPFYATPQARFNNAIFHKFLPGTTNGDPSNGGAGAGTTQGNTYSYKFEAEGDFDAVRFMWLNHTANAVNNCKAVVAATETADISTVSNTTLPIAGGTTYNALRSGTDTYGWNTVTWAGASTINIASGGSVATPAVATSDWITCNSIPRADGGTRPLLLLRLYQNGAVDGAHSFLSNVAYSNMRTPSTANRGRIVQIARAFGADAVGTLGTALSLATDCIPIAVQFRYRRRGLSVVTIGDSLASNDALVTDGMSNWLHRACFDLSTPDFPITPSNLGYSSQTSATYLAASKVLLATMLPDVAFFAPFSPNDIATPTRRSVWDGLARAADFLDFCATNRIIPIIWTPAPMDSYTAATDAFRVFVASEVRKMAVSKGIVVADMDAAVRKNATSPERWATAYYNDGIHPNEAGVELMSSVAKAAIQQAIATYQ